MTIDIGGLRTFIASSEGADPPIFAGRQAELYELTTAARNTWMLAGAGGGGSLSKRTHIIHGAPGAGKSTLLRELGRRLHAVPPAAGQPRLLYTNSADFEMDTSKFLARMAAMARLDADTWRQRLQRIASRMGGTLNLGLISASLDRDGSAQVPPRTIGNLHDNLPPDRWQAPVVLAIDEFQTIGSDDQAPVAKLLLSLHEANYGLPVMLVLAGLGDTVDRAMELGLSRLAQGTGWTLGCFDEAESDDLIAGWGRHFGLPDGDWRNTMRGIAEDCDHWPVHVQNALMALADEVVAADGKLEDVQSSVVRARSRKRQLAYYRQRMSPEIEGSAYLVGAMMRDLEPARGVIGVDRLIRQHCIDESGWRLPDGMTVNDFTRHLIHRGALHKHLDTGTVECPIPSFRAWLIEQGEPPHENDPEPDSRPSPF